MARRSSSRTSASRSTTSRRTASTAPAAASEEGGIGFEGGIAIATTITLIAACLMVDYFLGNTYGEGFFFKG